MTATRNRINNLPEMVRPKDFSSVVGCQDVITRLEQIDAAIGLAGQAIYISGRTGTGKTTLARIIASMVADPCGTEEMDAQDLTVERLRQIKSDCQYTPLFGDTSAYVVNEFHNVNPKTVSMLLTILEDSNVQRNSTWIFTATTEGQAYLFERRDIEPLLGRMLMFELTPTDDDYRAMAQRVSDVAKQYGFGDIPVARSYELIKNVGGSMRAALQSVASGSVR